MAERIAGLPARLERSLDERGRDLAVLVVRFGAMGDVLRTLPAVRLLRRGLPEARIHWVVDEAWRDLLGHHPDLDGLVAAPRREWSRLVRSPAGWPALGRSIARFRRALRAVAADLTLDFHGNLRSGITARLCGAPTRLGYAGHEQKEANALFSTHRVPSGDRRTSRVDRNLSLVRALGFAADRAPRIELPLAARGANEAGALLSALGVEPGGFAVVAPGASARQAYKRPPADVLASACRRLASRGVAPLVVWGPGEEAQAGAVVERAAGAARLAPPTSLAGLAALVERARLFVGGDSGPMHLACALGRPVVALYGPTDPRVNQPWGVAYRAVHPPGRRYTGIKRIDRSAGGFTGLTPDLVESAVGALLDETAPIRGARR